MAQARGLAELASLAAQPSACITAISGTVAGVSVAIISRSSTAYCASFEGGQSAWRDTYTLEPSEGLGSTSRIDEAFSYPTGWKVGWQCAVTAAVACLEVQAASLCAACVDAAARRRCGAGAAKHVNTSSIILCHAHPV